jgi:Tfp pilus assembly protein FimT
MVSPVRPWRAHNGYTLLEMIIVAGLVMTGAAIAVPVTMQMVRNARGDSAVTVAATFLQGARNRAVAERRNFEITFTSDRTATIERIEVPDGTKTLVDSLTLEGELRFYRESGLPDTPDRFGGTDAINFSGLAPVMFTSDGSLIDAAGDVTNATIHLAKPNEPETARAITIMGVTGLQRVWKWRGSSWLQ